MSLLSGVGNWLRKGVDDIGSVITGQPAHSPQPQTQQVTQPSQPKSLSTPQLIIKQGSSFQPPTNQVSSPQNTTPNQAQPPKINLTTNSLTGSNPLMSKPKLNLGSIKINSPSINKLSLGAKPVQTPSQPNAVNKFFNPIGGLVTGALKGTAELGQVPIGISKAIAGGVTHNQPAFQHGLQEERRGLNLAGEMAQSVPMAAASIGKSVFHPQTDTAPVVSNNPFSNFIFGKKPIESAEQTYHQAGGGAAGAGAATAQQAGNIISLLGAKGALDNLRAARPTEGFTPHETKLPTESEPASIKLRAQTPESKQSQRLQDNPVKSTPIQLLHDDTKNPLSIVDTSNEPLSIRQSGKGPDVDSFINRVQQTQPFTGNLESDIKKIKGHYTANRLALKEILKGNRNLNKDDLEAVYHHAEDANSPLTSKQQEVFNNYYKPLKDAESQAMSELSGKEANTSEDYIHRIAQNKNTNLEQFFAGRRQSPEEGINRKTVNSQKGRTVKSLTDENGNRIVVSIKSPKDDLGNVKGAKQVTALRSGKETEDLGTFRTKTNQELMDKEVKPFQTKLSNLEKEGNALLKVRVRGGVPDARINELAHKVALLQDKEITEGLTNANRRSIQQAVMKAKELERVKEPSTNATSRLDTINHNILRIKHAISNIEENYNPDELNGRVFLDKNKNRYTIGDATTKEIEANSNVRYYKEPLLNTALNLINTLNAKTAKDFMENWKLSPDFSEHAIKDGEGKIPDDWKSVSNPAFRGYYFDPKTADTIERYMGSHAAPTGLVSKAYNAVTNLVTQAIVLNPYIHGANLYIQSLIKSGNIKMGGNIPFIKDLPSGPVGFVKFNHSLLKLAKPGERTAMLDDYLRHGGHFMTYGKDTQTVLTKALEKSHLPGINKLNADAMSGIDASLRASLWDASKDGITHSDDVIKDIDRFMGDEAHVDEFASHIILFYHWLRTEVGALSSQIAHPLQNAGANINTALLFAAITYGGNALWQQITGNKNAHVRVPGEIGLVNDLSKTPGELANHQVPSVVTSHLNPIINAGINQMAGKDLYSGNQLKTNKQRAGELYTNLFAPSQYINKVSSGKSTPAEQVLNNFGFYTPHAAGAPAVTKGPLKIINATGAKPDTSGNDPTGYSQEIQYYNAKDKYITNNSSLSATEQNAADDYLAKNKTPTGQTILNGPAQTTANWAQLAANPGGIKALQQFYQASGSHGPEWDIPLNQLEVLARYKSLAPGDPERDVLSENNPFISQTEQASVNWSAKQTFSGNTVNGPGYVPYPNLTAEQNNLMAQATNLAKIPAANRTANQISQLNAVENNPQLQSAYTALDNYTNAERKSMGLSAINYIPNESPAVSNWSNAYEAASIAGRKTMRTQNPDMYGAMNQAYENSDLGSLEKQASIAYLSGKPSDELLSAIYNLGTYDVNSVSNANGTKTYSLTNFGGGALNSSGLPVLNAVDGFAPSSSSGYSSSSKSKKPPLFVKKYPKGPKPFYAKKKHQVFLNKGKPLKITKKQAPAKGTTTIKQTPRQPITVNQAAGSPNKITLTSPNSTGVKFV